VAITPDKEPACFYSAENAKSAGEKLIQKLYCMPNSSMLLTGIWECLSFRSRLGQHQELSACSRLVGPRALPC